MLSHLSLCLCFPSTENQDSSSTKDDIPFTLRIRAAVATALGAAAARAKLLADQEEREIEHFVATIIETEVTHSFMYPFFFYSSLWKIGFSLPFVEELDDS